MKGLVGGVHLIFSNNPFNLSQETYNPWHCSIDEDLTVKNSGLRLARSIHIRVRLATPKWIPAYCKKAGINSDGKIQASHKLLVAFFVNESFRLIDCV